MERRTSTYALFREAGRAIAITGFLDYRRYLSNLYKWVKKRAENYSYVSFSLELGLGNSNASRLIVIGERNLAEKSAEKVAGNIGLRGYRARYFEQLVAYANARSSQERDEAYKRLMVIKSRIEPDAISERQIGFFGNWLTPVIREMMQLPQFVGDPFWIQSNINFPVRLEEVKKSLQVLVELGFLTFNEKQETYHLPAATPDAIKADTLTAIAYHQQMIDIGKESLTRVPGKQREVSGCTTKMSLARYERFKKKLQDLVDEAAAEEDGDDQEIYQLNVQLFPFTKVGSK